MPFPTIYLKPVDKENPGDEDFRTQLQRAIAGYQQDLIEKFLEPDNQRFVSIQGSEL